MDNTARNSYVKRRLTSALLDMLREGDWRGITVSALCERAVAAAKEKKCKTIAAGGGVIANGYLRELLQKECGAAGIKLVLPEKKYCTDNAAMIAAEGLVQYHAKNFADLSINACAHIPLGKKGKQ